MVFVFARPPSVILVHIRIFRALIPLRKRDRILMLRNHRLSHEKLIASEDFSASSAAQAL